MFECDSRINKQPCSKLGKQYMQFCDSLSRDFFFFWWDILIRSQLELLVNSLYKEYSIYHLPFVSGTMILLEIWSHMLGNRSQLATGELEIMQVCLRVLLLLLNFLHDICLLWFLCFNAHLEIHHTFIWLLWCLIICITSSTIMGNEKLFEGHKMLWTYKYKYYTWLGRVVAIWLQYAESMCVGAFFVHIAHAHLQVGNIAWSLVVYI